MHVASGLPHACEFQRALGSATPGSARVRPMRSGVYQTVCLGGRKHALRCILGSRHRPFELTIVRRLWTSHAQHAGSL